MSEQTDLSLPPLLPYPVKITKLLVSQGDTIERTQALLHYSFKYKSPETGKTETRYGTWESKVDGKVEIWNVDPGDEIEKDYGPVLVVTEPCKHGMQIAGMCTICGKDMTEMDYMSTAPSERAKIKMDHSGEGPLLSAEEAAKLERENTRHLLGQRKLSLIVDLDQTILHATVDPTVGEWLKAKRAAEEGSTTPPPESVNFPALDDVVKFQLADDPMGQGTPHPSSPWYYIKPRPGLIRFMTKLSKLYEMHVYTMGTRSYANAVCAALDPSGIWFGSRILTRNESGSDRFKNLQRLFPSDQSMVVIIDDRADVWDWSPNLVRVIAFDFFVGTGDINSSFLPKQSTDKTPSPAPDSAPDEPSQESKSSPVHEPTKEKDERDEYVHKKMEERPLAKAQEVLEATSSSGKDENDKQSSKPDRPEHPAQEAILNNNDHELERVEAILVDVHERFYQSHDRYLKSRTNPAPHVGAIIPWKRKRTFSGVHIVFSGVFPLQKRPEETEEWKTAVAFGAKCSYDINPQVTHLVAAKPGTAKTDKALQLDNIKVVYVQWFHDSVARWERQPEQKYLMERGRRHGSVQPTDQKKDQNRSESKPVTVAKNGNEEGKVSALDGATENGTNATASATESVNNLVQDKDTAINGHPTDANGISPVEIHDEPKVEVTALHIDWAQVDKEVDDALASDDDEEEEASQAGTETDEERKMEGVILNTRGVKRRRGDSAPSTPSRLRFSVNAKGEENEAEDSPSSKRRKVEDITSTITGAGGSAQTSQEEDTTVAEDEDDFLAREMAGGADDWDDDDDDRDSDDA